MYFSSYNALGYLPSLLISTIVMASDSEDDEFPFIRFGTPLEELDETG